MTRPKTSQQQQRTQAEVAALLGLTPQGVRYHEQNALRKLRAALEGDADVAAMFEVSRGVVARKRRRVQ